MKRSSSGARVGVVGLGYVGLPLAVEFACRLVLDTRNATHGVPNTAGVVVKL